MPVSESIHTCRWGADFLRPNQNLTIVGLAVVGHESAGQARKKHMVKQGKDVVRRVEVDRLLSALTQKEQHEAVVLEQARQDFLREYQASERYKADLGDILKPSVEQALSQVHDYRAFTAQIIQNMNVILQSRFPGEELEAQLRKASHSEKAIYWAARLMETKLTAALFFMYPDRIDHPTKCTDVRFHGIVNKYWRIYEPSFHEKDLHVNVRGASYGHVFLNPEALGTIPHAFLDNALKYSPRGGNVDVVFTEDDAYITYAVSSLGPRIRKEEQAQIFTMFFRGAHARAIDSEGTGFGLALAAAVAERIGADLSVKQEEPAVARPDGLRLTTFTLRVQRSSTRQEFGVTQTGSVRSGRRRKN